MLPKLDEIHDFQTLKLKGNYYYIVTPRVTLFQNCSQALRGQKLKASLVPLGVPEYSFFDSGHLFSSRTPA